jgi:hypothetical protein
VIQGVVLQNAKNRFAALEIISKTCNMRAVVTGVATGLTGVRRNYLAAL